MSKESSKVVLVTGCSKGGIGHSLCIEFASKGCKVYATARRLEAMADLNHERIERLQLDVTNEGNIREAVQTLMQRHGKIDIVVNNAGVLCHGPVIDVPMEQVLEAFETNVFSVLRISKAVIPLMASRKCGTIVNIGSIMGEIPTPWSGPYSASKAGLKAISDTLYMECLPLNISIVHISTGGVKSHVAQNMLAKFQLPADSLYAGWIDSIIARITASQHAQSLPNEAFASRVVSAIMKNHPPRFITLGSSAGLWKLFGWLPRGWVLRLLWRIVGGAPKKE